MNFPQITTTRTFGPRGGDLRVVFLGILFSIIMSPILGFKNLLEDT
jgi:hypothetical protein